MSTFETDVQLHLANKRKSVGGSWTVSTSAEWLGAKKIFAVAPTPEHFRSGGSRSSTPAAPPQGQGSAATWSVYLDKLQTKGEGVVFLPSAYWLYLPNLSKILQKNDDINNF